MKINQKLCTDDPTKLKNILEKYGVAILSDYFDESYADNVFSSATEWLINLDIGLTEDEQTWNMANTPLGPRTGLYQSIISHAPIFWDLREKMYNIFSIMWNNDKLLTSIDGATILPGSQKPKSKVVDWAHIDQTCSSDFMCWQSQFVATDTTASFVATIKSHLKHKEFLTMSKILNPESKWHKFDKNEIIELKKMFGEAYQTPIYAKKGNVIFWDSRTIHSAKYQDDNSWRCVFYISMRPENNFLANEKELIKTAAKKGLTTNHWASKIFATVDKFGRKNTKLTNLLKNLESLSYTKSMSPLQKRLCGFLKYK